MIPKRIVLVKLLTERYFPVSITLITEELFEPFMSRPSGLATLYYGRSYTGNALACAAAKASLEVFERENVPARLGPKIELLRESLASLRQLRWVRDLQQCGFIAGIEVSDPSSDNASDGLGAKICVAARRYGLLTRPIKNVIVLMLPFCIGDTQLRQCVHAIRSAINEVCEGMFASTS